MNSDSDATDADPFTRIEYVDVLVDGDIYRLCMKRGREVPDADPLPIVPPDTDEQKDGAGKIQN
jgi:hypothetical protein